MKNSKIVRAFLTVSLSGAVVVASSGVAHAEKKVDLSPNSISSKIEKAANAAGVEGAQKNAFSSDGESTSVVGEAADTTSVSATNAGSSVVQSSEYGKFSVSLPGGGNDTQVSSDGSTVVLSDASKASHSITAVSSTEDDSTRAQVVLMDSKAAESYSYGFEDADSIELNADGGASVFVGVGADKTEVSKVKPAWARDANGRAVPTHYEVSGNTLIQVVDHKAGNFAYPIVADPSWSSIWSAIRKGGAKVASAAKWLGSKAGWVVGKTWSGVTWAAPKGYKAGKFLVKKAGPLGIVLCATGGGWAWYRSDANGWVRVGDAVSGCLL